MLSSSVIVRLPVLEPSCASKMSFKRACSRFSVASMVPTKSADVGGRVTTPPASFPRGRKTSFGDDNALYT